MKKYLVVRFDNDFTVTMQQTLYCIKNMLIDKINYDHHLVDDNDYEFYHKQFLNIFTTEFLSPLIYRYAYLFHQMFGLLVHSNPKLDDNPGSFEWFSNVIYNVDVLNEEEIITKYSEYVFKDNPALDDIFAELRDGGEWLTIEYDGDQPISVEGGFNYIGD